MRKLASLLIMIIVLVAAVPIHTYAAADRTAEVSAAASSLQFRNTALQVYPSVQIDMENPEYNLCRVEVFFKTAQNSSVYQLHGDTVSFYIKSSRDAEIAWVDKNASGDYEKGEEYAAAALADVNGAYVQNARLTRTGSVIFYIGSHIPGDFTVTVYTDKGGHAGLAIGSQASSVNKGDGTVILTPTTDNKGLYSLNGSGSSANPYEATAGADITLRARVRAGNYPLAEEPVTYKTYSKAGGYVEIGTEKTDEEGVALLDFETEKAGLYSFQAIANGQESEEVYIKFMADKPDAVEAKTEDRLVVPSRNITKIEFYVKDDNGNVIDSKGQDIVEFSITDEPEGSKYVGFQGRKAPSDMDGVAGFGFEPDVPGRYTVTCTLIGERESDSIDLDVVYFGKVTALAAALKNNGEDISSVKYTDSNNDGEPDEAGRLEVRLINKDGAAKLAAGSDLYNLSFAAADGEAVSIEANGAIIVKDKNYRGTIPVVIYDKNSQVSLNYNLKVSGTPAALKSSVKSDGKKALVTIQYMDAGGNDTYGSTGEELTVVVPAGVSVTELTDFDQTGKATFVLNAVEYKKYDFSVLTKDTRISKSFSVTFTPAVQEAPSSRNIIMFIGMKNYTQGGQAKISDVAPFIKDGRTFVAVRPIADAFGAAVDWNPSTQTVTLTRSDLLVTIVIGSNRITVVKDGKTSVITADVPAFITSEGRTVLPFRAVGDAFGASVSYDDVTKAVSYAL